MVRKIKNRKTVEQCRAQAEELQDSIAEQVDQLRHSEQWARFLKFAQSFHRFSLGNLLLILDQCPTATRVAGFRQWQAKGRQVRKGEALFGSSAMRRRRSPPSGPRATTRWKPRRTTKR